MMVRRTTLSVISMLLNHPRPRCPRGRALPLCAGAGADARLDQGGREGGEVATLVTLRRNGPDGAAVAAHGGPIAISEATMPAACYRRIRRVVLVVRSFTRS